MTLKSSLSTQLITDLLEKQQEMLASYFHEIDPLAIERLVDQVLLCHRDGGKVLLTGVGKSSIVAKKGASTLASIGIEAYSLCPINALHGDIGTIQAGDLVVLISKSGESDELIELVPFLTKKQATTCALVSNATSRLARICSISILLPLLPELCPHDLAPTNSVIMQLLFLDAVAIATMHLRQIDRDFFAANHPAGRIGKRLVLTVDDVMIPYRDLPIAHPEMPLHALLVIMSAKACGCLLVVDPETHHLLGIFTDGDLRRVLQFFGVDGISLPIGELMTHTPRTIRQTQRAVDAVKLMEQPQQPITVLPVLSEENKLIGLVKLHDLVQCGIC